MKLFRKSMSVFLVVVLLMTACLPAFSGAAAVVIYSEQYNALANLLLNDHVRDLSNYEIESNKSEDIITEGFNTEAGAFSYSHVVYAKDDVDNSILRAANRFYYIAESLMSYSYGVGFYNADLLYREVLGKVQNIFDSITVDGWFDMDNKPVKLLEREENAYFDAVNELDGEITKEAVQALGFSYYYDEDVTFYVDSLGNRYYPTDEELALYADACAALREEGIVNPTVGDMGDYGLEFAETSIYNYYNVATVINYFMGTGSHINTGNWYHEFDFIVRTDVETVLLNMESLANAPSSTITVTTGIYRFRYQRQYDSLGTTAQYFFKQTDNQDTYDAYQNVYGLDANPQVLSYLAEGDGAVGQAAKLYTKESKDTQTLAHLKEINRAFNEVFSVASWDAQFLSMTNADIEALQKGSQYYTLRSYAEELTEKYSNDVLVHLFPDTIGNIKTLQYLLTSSKQAPSRIVRGSTSYFGTVERMDSIVDQFDALFTDEDVMATINMFLGDTLNDLFVGTAAEGKTYATAQEMVSVLLNGMLYDDSLCTLIVQNIYPMIADLLVDLLADLIDLDLTGLLESLADTLNVTLTPAPLGELLEHDYPGAAKPLIAAGDKIEDWADVDWDAMNWTKVVNGKETPVSDRDSFAYALVAAFRGLRRAVLCLFANDNYWTVDIPLLIELEEQAAYRDLIIPLFEALGLRAADNISDPLNVQWPETGTFFHSGDYTMRARNEIMSGDSYLLDIVMPLLLWVEGVVAKQPIQTVFSLLPNLVNFIIRGGGDNIDDCLNKIELNLTILSGIKVDIDSLGGLLEGTLPPLDSLNNILAEFIDLSYTDENGNEIPYALPKIHEQKWVDACGTVVQTCDPTDENPVVSAYSHYLEVEHPGFSFLFVLRFVLTALGYRYTIYDTSAGPAPAYLIECLGISLDDELFMGMTFGDLIFNIMLHPDEALCALLELFYPNENEVEKEVGNYYEGYEYAYPLEQIEFYTDTLLNPSLNPTLGYGTKVVYSDMWTQEMANDVIEDIGPLADNILALLGVEGMENGLGAFLEDLIYGYISDDTVNMLFNLLYQLLSGVDGSLGDIDIVKLLDHIFDVEFTPDRAALRVYKMLNEQLPDEDAEGRPSFWSLHEKTSWESVFLAPAPKDDAGENGDAVALEEGGENEEAVEMVVTDVNFNWGLDNAEKNYGMSKGEAFIRIISALLSPASFIFEFLLLDQPLDVFGLISLPSYAGYQYWFIALLELLTCPASKILTYKDYYENTVLEEDRDIGESNTFYYILSPILGLVDAVIANPIPTVFNLLPNLMFFISVGAMNGLVNNIAHFAYVLLDILKPILNAYDLLDGLLSNIDLGGVKINLNLPLNIDFNSLASTLIGSLTGDLIVLGTKETLDENGNVIAEEDISLTLPYIDFYTLCAGRLERLQSKEGRRIVRLDDAGGGDLLTALLRLVVSVLFIDENLDAVIDLLMTVSPKLDDYDKETVMMLLSELTGMIDEYATGDIVLLVLYYLITAVSELSTTLVDLLADSGLTITDLIAVLSLGDINAIIDFISGLGDKQDPPAPDGGEGDGDTGDGGEGDEGDEGEQPDQGGGNDGGGGMLGSILSIFDKLKAFFDKLILFIKKTFGMA